MPGKLGQGDYVTLSLKDDLGKEISANEYILLLADEKLAIPKLRSIGKDATEKKEFMGQPTITVILMD